MHRMGMASDHAHWVRSLGECVCGGGGIEGVGGG